MQRERRSGHIMLLALLLHRSHLWTGKAIKTVSQVGATFKLQAPQSPQPTSRNNTANAT